MRGRVRLGGSLVGGDGFAQGVHEADDLASLRGGSFVVRDGRVLDLGLDQLLERDLVAVDKLLRRELGGFALDELLGEIE